jgi:anion-transporting  ArsA/GET3 family ATPase
MSGMAGTSKTTISYSLCVELDTSHKLAASFFCSRSLPECRNVNLVIPSIAYQLAELSGPFRCALSRILEKNPDVLTLRVLVQFEDLIAKPLDEVEETFPEGLVVAVDALDECESKERTSQILEALLTKTPHLPIKFIVSSHP